LTVSEEQLSLEDVLRFFQRNVLFIVGGALLTGVAMLGLLLVRDRPMYQTSALLEVEVDQATSNPGGRLLPARGYLQLARSATTLKTLHDTLEQSPEEDNGDFVQSDLGARLVVPERWERAGRFLIELEGRAHTSEQAARLVNAWTEVVIQLDSRLTVISALETVERQLSDRVAELESRREQFEEQIDVLQRQRSSVPPVFSLRTTPTESKLDGELGPEERPVAVVTEEPNPLYIDLTSELSSLEVELENLEPTLRRSVGDLALVRHELQAMEAATTLSKGALPGYGSSRATESGEPSRSAETADPDSDEPGEPGTLARRALSARSPIKLVEPAQPPKRPMATRHLLKVLAALVGGGILGFLVSVAREALKSSSEQAGVGR